METEDLEITLRTVRPYPSGYYTVNGAGNRRAVLMLRETFVTRDGREMWRDDWDKQMAKARKERNGAL